MTTAPKPKRDDDPPPRGSKAGPVRCAHPSTRKVDGKICCAKCGVQLYL